MRFIASYIFCFFMIALPIFASANLAIDTAQRQLELLDPKLENNRELRDIYLQIIDTHSQINETQQQVNDFKISLQTLPRAISQLKIQLSKEQPNKDSDKADQVQLAKLAKTTKKMPLAALELELTQLQSTQLELQQNRDKIENKISTDNEKPVELRKFLAELKQQPISLDATGHTKVQLQLDEAFFSLKNLRVQSINLELLVIPLNNKYNRLKLSWTDTELLTLGQTIRYYQDKVQRLRQSATDKLLKDAVPANTNKDNPEPISKLIEQNNDLSNQLRASVANAASAVERLRILEQQFTLILQSYKIIQQQLALSENSFGIELRNFSQRFSTVKLSGDSRAEITRIKLLNIELNQLKLDMAINKPVTTSWDEESLDDLQSLQNTSLNLISNLHTAYARELDELSKTLTLETQIDEQFKQGEKLLTEYLIWLPSVPNVDSNWLMQISSSTKTQLQQALQAINQITLKPTEQWLRWAVIFILVSLVALFLLRYQHQHEKMWSQQIGNVVRDRFSRSLKLLFLAPVISLPIPLILYILLNHVLAIQDQNIQNINNLLCFSVWFYLSFFFWLKRPYGLFISHLDIPEDFCIKLKKLLIPMYFLGVPMAWLLLYFDSIPSLELHSGLGRLVFIALTILAGAFWGALWKVSPRGNLIANEISWWQQPKLWLVTLVAIHVALVGAALFGYLFTSSIVMFILLAITLIFYTVFSIYRLGVRWLLIAERRITFAKARARRVEILAAREKNEEVPVLEENYLGVKSVSEQASVLLKALSFSLLFFALWFLVKNFLPSLDILDNVILWSNDITTASGISSESISLRSVITSAFIIGLTILAAYNLPGLLELLVLRHINLTPGTSYAITTITRYLLIIATVMAGASQIGVEWAKLQWLVAAMGVGLGFGLQEIVANFVSGIIILFEKPVRIGDTITIGGVTGKVTKIKIRATTIADWDRKEVIIPNKTFVTDQLINWSLSDAITRVVVHVGVAHGSDTELVHRLILQAANSNYRVLQSPAPEVFFTTFGNSTLDFELRFFVDSLSDRNLAIHEINQQINQAFKQQSVSIAFPQLDVHLHRNKN
ncbi:MAG: mechanosensitive ion channel domain-containing protein [Oceanospirillaceae bacterium]